LGIPDVFIEQGSIDELQQFCKISVDSLEIIFSSY
jgi:1-deoxy-D-xylulose-5-phosphate synthase